MEIMLELHFLKEKLLYQLKLERLRNTLESGIEQSKNNDYLPYSYQDLMNELDDKIRD